jgi:hypothetical protein
VSFSFSLTGKDSTAAPPIVVNIADLPRLSSGSSKDDDAVLPIPGFEIILSIVAIAFVARRTKLY